MASRPSISGICTSIRTTSYFCRSRASSASRPLCNDIGPVAHLAEDAGGDLLVDDVVLGQQKAQRAAMSKTSVDLPRGAEQLVGDPATLERRGQDAVHLLVMGRFWRRRQ